jgi:hypothetical protein
MNKWLAVRLGLVGSLFLYGALVAPVAFEQTTFAEAWTSRWQMLGVLFGFGIVALLFVVGIQVLNPRSAPKWRYPSWSINPFLFAEPLQPFHLIGYGLLAQGAGTIINGAVRGLLSADGVLFTTLGAGVISGVHVCALVYRRKMTHGT